jgi:hypothetical protein
MTSTFHFVRIAGSDERCYQVRLDDPVGRLIGTVAAIDSGWWWQASFVVAGKLHTRQFADREKAATWLLSIPPG